MAGKHKINSGKITGGEKPNQIRPGKPAQMPAFSSLIEAMPLGVVYQDASGAITYANPAAQEILGLSLDEMQGRKSVDVRWRAIHENGTEFPGETHPAMIALRTGKPVKDVIMGVFHPQTEKFVWLLINAVPEFQAGQSTPYQVFTTFADITFRKQEEVLREAAYAIAEASRSLASQMDCFQEVHHQVSRLMDANNFFIALYDHAADFLTYVYQVDEKNEPVDRPVHPGAGFSAAVLHTGKSQRFQPAGTDHALAETGIPPKAWLGAPLILHGGITGLMAVQSYHDPDAYAEHEQYLLDYLSTQVTAAIDRMQMAETLRQVENRNTALIENAPDGITVTDATGQITFASPLAFKIFGYSAEDMQGITGAALTHPDDLPRVLTAINAIVTDPTRVEKVEYRFRQKDGSYRWIESSFSNLFAVPGVNGMVINFRDITASKQAQDELRKINAQYRLIADNSNDVIWVLDLQMQKFTFVSPSVQKLRGYTPEEVMQQPLSEALTPASAEIVRKRLAANIPLALASEPIPPSVVELDQPCKDGSIVSTEVTTNLVFEEDRLLVVGISRDISERKKANERFEQLAQNIEEVFWIVDPKEYRAEYLSPGLEKTFGLDPNAPANFTPQFAAHIFPEDTVLLEKARRDEAAGVPTQLEYRYMHPDGSLRWIWQRSSPVKDEQGNVLRTVGVSSDITAGKRSQLQLKERESFLQSIVSSAPGYILGIDLDGYFTYSNKRWKGESDEAFQRIRFVDQVHPEHAGLAANLIQESIASRQIRRAEMRVMDFTGDYHWWDVVFSPVIVDEIVERMTIFVYDIEERKQAELDLAASEEKYRLLTQELEQRVKERTAEVQDLYDNAPTGYHSTDRDGVFRMINQTELSWLGYTREEMIGKMKNTDLLSAEGLEPHDKWFEKVKSEGYLRDIEVNLVRKDGSILPVLINAIAIYDQDGSYIASRTTMFDNTERKKVQDALRESERSLRQSRDQLSAANAALEKASKLKDEFLASMSHELRTPLTGVLGLSEALQMEIYGALNDRQHNALKNIENSGRHLLELINDILDLSKIEADKLELQFEPCDVADICQISLQLTKGLAQKKHQIVGFSANPLSAVIWADPRRFKQMLVNLLSNAVKFTPEGGSLGLEVNGSEQDQSLHLTVWDKGIGIKPEDMDRLFKPFTQLDSSLSREHSGTGLGLSLVARLAELHGGSVKVESVIGEGSRFTISLPWEVNDKTRQKSEKGLLQAQTPASHRPKQAEPAAAKGTVLFADDDEVVLQTMTDFLHSRGYNILKARTGKELVELAQSAHVDIILTDIQMPGMDGVQAIRQIRSLGDPYLARVPIVAITALAMPGDEQTFLDAGANKYISKPLMLNKMAQLIEALIQDPGAE